MNKKLVAVAVAAVLAAPMAQAQTANVTLYGRLNIDLEYVDVSGGNPSVTRLSSNSSRFGLRGTESLGGGLNAIWQIESSVGGDAGGGTIAGRDTFVGLQGSWGQVRFGNFLAPYDDMHPIFGNGPSYLTSILATAALWANNGGGSKGTGTFDDRLPNSLRYDTPNISGFQGGIQVSLWDDAGAGGARDAFVLSMAGTYRNGPFQGGVAYEANRDVRGNNLDDWAFTATGAWNFGMVRVFGLYERLDYDTPTGSLKRDLWGVGANGSAGPGTWHVMYQYADEGSGGSTTRIGGFTSGANTDAYHITASYNYPLSKRTAVYVGYSRVDNENNASYNFNINPYRQVAAPAGANGPIGLTYNGFVLGTIHLF
ncbi:MAG: porin [Burkholderiales bacterium]|nr:porin [Burkholderiales bacterium]GIK85730.1 MAG: porin [Betaproteobacteria bacterium]